MCPRYILHYRNGLSTDSSKKISYAEMMTDDEQMSRDERSFRLWINSLGISSYVNNLFEDLKNGYVYLKTVLLQLCMAFRNFKPSINLYAHSVMQMDTFGSCRQGFTRIGELETCNQTSYKDAI